MAGWQGTTQSHALEQEWGEDSEIYNTHSGPSAPPLCSRADPTYGTATTDEIRELCKDLKVSALTAPQRRGWRST